MIVFGKKDCQGCKLTTKMLDSFGVDYEYRDVDDSQEDLDLLTSLGYRQLPVVMSSNDEHFSGFRPDLLRDFK